MDPERETRREVMDLLRGAFACYEEVSLGGIRCDVLAVPLADDFAHHPFAFECKRPSQDWHYAPWAKTIRQASDYVGCQSPCGVVSAAFVYPAPMALGRPRDRCPKVRSSGPAMSTKWPACSISRCSSVSVGLGCDTEGPAWPSARTKSGTRSSASPRTPTTC